MSSKIVEFQALLDRPHYVAAVLEESSIPRQLLPLLLSYCTSVNDSLEELALRMAWEHDLARFQAWPCYWSWYSPRWDTFIYRRHECHKELGNLLRKVGYKCDKDKTWGMYEKATKWPYFFPTKPPLWYKDMYEISTNRPTFCHRVRCRFNSNSADPDCICHDPVVPTDEQMLLSREYEPNWIFTIFRRPIPGNWSTAFQWPNSN